MSFAFQPFYTGDYYRDTRHLSMLQHGAYRLLLDHCWDQRGPLPLDIEKCYRICGASSKEERDAVVAVIEEFFVRMEDGYYNRRMQKEIERAAAISFVRSEAGRLGGKARAKQMPSKCQANAKQMPLPPQPQPQPQSQSQQHLKTERETRARQGTRLPPDWALPDEWRDWARRERPDLDPQATADRFRDYWCAKPGKDGTKLDWAATWRNWVRNERHGGVAAGGETAYQRRMRERVAEMSPRIAARAPGADPWEQREAVDVDAKRVD